MTYHYKQTRFNRHLAPLHAMPAKQETEGPSMAEQSESESQVASIVGNPEFLTGGKSFFTVDNGKGEHFTYKISVSDDGKVHFVSVLKGPDNYRNYKYMGLYEQTYPSVVHAVKLTKASKFEGHTKEVTVFNWAAAVIHGHTPLPDGYAIMHAGKCCVCARKLTTPDSIKAGIGPTCASKGGM